MKLIVLVLLLIAGCYPYPVDVPDEVSIDNSFSPAQQVVIRDAMEAWCRVEGYCPVEVPFTVARKNGAIILDTNYARHGRAQDSAAFESQGRVIVNADHSALEDLHVFWRVIAHEIGHMSGLSGHRDQGLMRADVGDMVNGPLDLSDL